MSTKQSTPIWKFLLPLLVGFLLALMPSPAGLAPHAWYFFAIFATLVVALMLEPLPGGALGLIAVTLVTLLAPWAFYSPESMAKPGFKVADEALKWALSGFSNTTIWLVFCAFMFALGYEKTGLGERLALHLVRCLGKRSLSLGYAVMLSDLVLAPVTPSNTARSGGIVFPIARQIPPLFQSEPNDPSARRLGSYIMWVAIASTCVTSTLFLTGLAPNLLSVELIHKTAAEVNISWSQWFFAALPIGVILLLLVPFLSYVIYPPTVKSSPDVSHWATEELRKRGAMSQHEWILIGLMVLALLLWIFGTKSVNPTTTALLVVSLMVLLGVVNWGDILKDGPAWNTLAWFATLVAMADGLSKVGFIAWIAKTLSSQLSGFSTETVLIVLLCVYFFSHYLFASVTAHVTAMLPVILSTAAAMPGVSIGSFALMLVLANGLMGVLTPYGTGPSPVYASSGYIPSPDFWRLGLIFGLLYFAVYLAVCLMFLGPLTV